MVNSATRNDEEACEWVVRLDRTLSSAETEAFRAWLDADPRRAGALLRGQAMFAMLDRGRALDPSVRDVSSCRNDVLRYSSRRNLLRVGSGGIATLLVGGLIWQLLPKDGERIATAIGEIKTFRLEDGSTALVNSATQLRTRFAADGRHIDLAAGELWLDVAKDRHRPFTVSAGPARIQAVGTAFSVRRHPRHVETIVTEGVVRIWSVQDGNRPVLASAGQRASVSLDGTMSIRPIDEVRVGQRLAWREGLILLDGMTLAQAAAEFNRYNRHRLAVAPQVADRQIVGLFRTDDVDGFIRSASAALGVETETEGDLTLIRPMANYNIRS